MSSHLLCLIVELKLLLSQLRESHFNGESLSYLYKEINK